MRRFGVLFVLALAASFTQSAVANPRAAIETPALDAAPLVLDRSFAPRFSAPAEGTIFEAIPLADGRVLAGGFFAYANNTGQRHLACFKADGSLDPAFTAHCTPDGTVFDLATQADGLVLIAGFFRTLGSARVPGLARLTPDGHLDPTFQRHATCNGVIRRILVQPDGRILIAGAFSRFGDTAVPSLARLQPDGSLDRTFQPQLQDSPGQLLFVNAVVRTPDGALFVVYRPTSHLTEIESPTPLPADGVEPIPTRLVRLLPDGHRDPSFDANLPARLGAGSVAVLPKGGGVFVGGYGGLLRLTATGETEVRFQFESAHAFHVSALHSLPDGNVLVVGHPTAGASSSATAYILDANGTALARLLEPKSEYHFFTGASIDANGRMLLFGRVSPKQARLEFSKSINRILRTDAHLVRDNSFRSSVGGTTGAGSIVIGPSGQIYVDGRFWNIDGASRFAFARLHNDGSVDRGFDAGMGFNALPTVLVPMPDGSVVAAGALGYDEEATGPVARIKASGLIDDTFAPDLRFNGRFRGGAALRDGTIVLVGSLSGRTVDDQFYHLIRFDQTGKIDRLMARNIGSWMAPGAGRLQTVVENAQGQLLVAGQFAMLQGRRRSCLARIYSEAVVDPKFEPETDDFATIDTVALLKDERIFVSGWTKNPDGRPARIGMARLLPDGHRDHSFVEPSLDGLAVLSATLLGDDTVLVTTRVFDTTAPSFRRLVRLDRSGRVMQHSRFDLQTDYGSTQVEPARDGSVYLFGEILGVNGEPRHGAARLIPQS